MAVTMSGSQFREMMASDQWGEKSYWDEVLIQLDGVELPEDEDWNDHVQPGTQVTLIGGYYIADPDNIRQPDLDFEVFAQRWLDRQIHMTLMLTFPRTQEADVRAILHKNLPTVGVS